MFGKFQQSRLRIEVKASVEIIHESLLCSAQLKQWLWMQKLPSNLPDRLVAGTVFTSHLGMIPVRHQVDRVVDNGVRFLLSEGIDGYHDWLWGDRWVQSCLEGVSLLPLNLGQTVSLMSLRGFVEAQYKL